MRLRDLVGFAWSALTDRKLRAVLTIIGIVIGPATIVALLGATQGLSNSVSASFATTGSTNIYVSAVGKGSSLTAADVTTMQSMQYVKAAIPYYSLTGSITEGTETTTVQVVAINFTQLTDVFPSLALSTGSVPSASDETSAAIGYSVAYPDVSGASNVTVNDVIDVSLSSFGGGFGAVSFSGGGGGAGGPSSTGSLTGTKSFVVTGVYKEYGSSFTIDPDAAVFIPLSEGQTLTHSEDYTGVILVASSAGTVNDVTTEVSDAYGSTVRTSTVSTILSTVESVSSELGTILASVGSISVLVAFIAIMTTMFSTVTERVKEIGILKALGYTSRNIMSVFLIESTITGFIGGVVGAAAGAGISYFIIGFFRSSISFGGLAVGGGPTSSSSSVTLTPSISPELLLLAIGLATLVGALAGLIPAWRASRLVPVRALRAE